MANGSYQVIFSGKIVEHADLDMVKANVGRAFSMPAERVEALFSGRRLILKKNLDQATAERYRTTLQRAGALCELEDTAANTAVAESVQASSLDKPPTTPGGDESAMSMANTGITLVEAILIPDANIDTHGIDMAEAGVTLGEVEAVADANIDTGDMAMAEAGVSLAEVDSVPDASIDTGELAMADAGVTLVDAEEFLPVEFDLGDMSLDEAGIQLGETEEVAAANIDTSKLSLD